jgi:chromosome segregation ATPase
MSYVKRNSTLILFFLVLVSIIFLGSSVVIYQKSLTGLNDDLRNQNNEIRSLNTYVTGLKLNLSNLKEIIDIQMMREENLSEQFIDLKSDKENLEDDFASTSISLNDTKKDLEKSKFTISSLVEVNRDLNSSYDDLDELYEKVLDDINDVCDEAVSLNISECSEYI